MRERATKVVLVLVGLLFVATSYPWAQILWYRQESMYGDAMMLSLYITLGVFLLLAARSPANNRSVIGFAAWSSLAHAATMAIQARTDVSERTHLLVGVAIFLVVSVVLLVFAPGKLPAKPAAQATATAS